VKCIADLSLYHAPCLHFRLHGTASAPPPITTNIGIKASWSTEQLQLFLFLIGIFLLAFTEYIAMILQPVLAYALAFMAGITSPVVLTVVFIRNIFGLWFLLSILAVTLMLEYTHGFIYLLWAPWMLDKYEWLLEWRALSLPGDLGTINLHALWFWVALSGGFAMCLESMGSMPYVQTTSPLARMISLAALRSLGWWFLVSCCRHPMLSALLVASAPSWYILQKAVNWWSRTDQPAHAYRLSQTEYAIQAQRTTAREIENLRTRLRENPELLKRLPQHRQHQMLAFGNRQVRHEQHWEESQPFESPPSSGCIIL